MTDTVVVAASPAPVTVPASVAPRGPQGIPGPPGPAGGAQAPYTYTAAEVGVYYNGQTTAAGAPSGWNVLTPAAQAAANGAALAAWLASGTSNNTEVLFLPFIYYVPPNTIKLGFRRSLRGVRVEKSILQCVGTGDWLIAHDETLGGDNRTVRNLTITGGGTGATGADSGVTHLFSHGLTSLSNTGSLTVEDCILQRATDAVVHILGSTVSFKRCFISRSKVGIWAESSSESHADEIYITHCSEAGMFLEGAGVSSASTRGGRTQVNGGLWRISNCVTSYVGDGLVFNGIANSTIKSTSVEGANFYTGVGGSDGISYRCIGSTGVMGDALRANGGKVARFESNSINCHLGRISHASLQEVVFLGNVSWCSAHVVVESWVGAARTKLVFDDGAGSTWNAYMQWDGRIQSIDGTPPSQGRWYPGDIVWNAAPASGQPVAWMASAGGYGEDADWLVIATAA